MISSCFKVSLSKNAEAVITCKIFSKPNLLKIITFVFGKMEYFLIENFEIDKETGITVDQEFVDYVLVF